MYHVIIAGGSGSRFWPKSRRDNPKQLLDVLGSGTLIRQTVNRLKELDPIKRIFIVASRSLCQKLHQEIPEIPPQNFISEPSGKNTAPAIGLAAIHIFKKDPNAVMGVYPADHLINGQTKFVDTIREAEKIASEKNVLVTLGVVPTYPATGYGYIQYNAKKTNGYKNIFKVKTFAEKPQKQVAKDFYKSGEFLWNSGIFIWRAEIILLDMKTFMCELHDSLDSIFDALDTPQYETVLDREWELVSPESIDYGILEKAKNVYTIISDFEWSDLGSWQSLFENLDKNDAGNVFQGEVVSIESKNNLVMSPNRLTAIIGVDDMTIINLFDATLIMPHSKAEQVKDVVKMLTSLKKDEYL